MKKIISLFGILTVLGCASAQTQENIINAKLDSKTGKEIVLIKLVNDSRCPEKVQCMWAGEVSFEVAAYEDKKLVEQVEFTLNKDTVEEIKSWFIKHSPENKLPLKAVSVLPYPKDGVSVKPEDYYIQLVY